MGFRAFQPILAPGSCAFYSGMRVRALVRHGAATQELNQVARLQYPLIKEYTLNHIRTPTTSLIKGYWSLWGLLRGGRGC